MAWQTRQPNAGPSTQHEPGLPPQRKKGKKKGRRRGEKKGRTGETRERKEGEKGEKGEKGGTKGRDKGEIKGRKRKKKEKKKKKKKKKKEKKKEKKEKTSLFYSFFSHSTAKQCRLTPNLQSRCYWHRSRLGEQGLLNGDKAEIATVRMSHNPQIPTENHAREPEVYVVVVGRRVGEQTWMATTCCQCNSGEARWQRVRCDLDFLKIDVHSFF